jgi:murein DD-endopeptidase MepM/ murein hydrolase activator NlpD
MLGLALSIGTAGWGSIYQTEQANAANNTIVPPDLVPSHLKLEGASLSEQELAKPKSRQKIDVMRIGHLKNPNQFRAVNWASKSDRLLKQQQVMLQNLQEKREQLNTNLGKLKAKNLPSGHTTIRQPVAKTYNPLAIEATPTTAIPQLPALTAPPTIPDHDRQIYQVRAGDTLEIIARRYNTTRERLIEANKLKNPDLILVAQQLQIPVFEPSKSRSNDNTSLIPPSNLSENKKSSQLQATEVSLGMSETSKFEEQTTAVNQPFGRVDSWLESATELYTTKLRAEIIELREQYRNQIRGSRDNRQTASIQSSNYETTDTPSLVPARANYSPLKRVENASTAEPENLKLQLPTLPELPNLRTSKQAPVATEFDSSPSISSNSDSSQSQDSLVSTAPSSVENYNQIFRIPVGEFVAPELPPLSSPERYLPSGTSSQFDGYIWPSVGVITSGYGWRWGRMHRGIDIAGPIGTPIVAAAAGEVVSAGWSSGGYGNLVEVKHGDGSITLYAHNNKILVRPGQWVEQGEQIAEIGSTGYSTGPHLHFEIRPDGQTTANPIAFLPKN